MLSGIHLFHDVFLESEEKGSFSSIVQAEENNFGLFVDKSETLERPFEPIPQKHAKVYILFITRIGTTVIV